MSIDLDFWKCKGGNYFDNKEVYQRVCCEGEAMEGLDELPIPKILDRVAAVFRDWTALDSRNYEKEGHGAFSVFTTPQSVRFDCYGMSGNDMNLLIDVMLEFDCPLYDPQIETRFDAL